MKSSMLPSLPQASGVAFLAVGMGRGWAVGLVGVLNVLGGNSVN